MPCTRDWEICAVSRWLLDNFRRVDVYMYMYVCHIPLQDTPESCMWLCPPFVCECPCEWPCECPCPWLWPWPWLCECPWPVNQNASTIYNFHKFTSHKKTVFLIFQEKAEGFGRGSRGSWSRGFGRGGRGCPRDPHSRLLIDVAENCWKVNYKFSLILFTWTKLTILNLEWFRTSFVNPFN